MTNLCFGIHFFKAELLGSFFSVSFLQFLLMHDDADVTVNIKALKAFFRQYAEQAVQM